MTGLAAAPQGVIRIAALYLYPVKSARGIALDEVELTNAGFAEDRRWMFTTPAGRFLTQRQLPQLALVRPQLSATHLTLSAPDMADLHIELGQQGARVAVVVWDDHCDALDEGEAAARWATQLLGSECRLVRFDGARRRLSARKWTGELEAENRFSDGFPILVIAEASLEDLNQRLPRPLPMNRFRPNIVLQGVQAYDEDRLHELLSGDMRLRLVKACTRCAITTTDQEHGTRDGEEPLRTLKGYRFDRSLHGVLFGQNAVVVSGVGTRLRRGQLLQAQWK